jgi:hypothetical protein
MTVKKCNYKVKIKSPYDGIEGAFDEAPKPRQIRNYDYDRNFKDRGRLFCASLNEAIDENLCLAPAKILDFSQYDTPEDLRIGYICMEAAKKFFDKISEEVE